MKHNYILLPENIQRRPLPGHRHRPKKVKNVSPETFSPYSMAGRRALGEAKDKVAMTGNGKKAEERSGLRLRKLIKDLNKFLAIRRNSTPSGDEPMEADMTPEHTVVQDTNDSVAVSLQLPPRSSAVEVIEVHQVKRPRENAISGSLRVTPEAVPGPLEAVNPPDTLNFVGTAGPAGDNGTNPGAFTGAEHAHIANGDNIRLQRPTSGGIVQPHGPPVQPAVPNTFAPAFPEQAPAPHIGYRNPNLPGPNHHPQQFWFPHVPLSAEAQLERVAIACAYGALDGPMDIDPVPPTFMPNNNRADIELEHIAVACAYAAMDEPMDTTVDDTQGPVFHVIRQEQHVFNPDGFIQYPPQLPHFDLGAALQPRIQQTFQEDHYFLDHDQRLRPPLIYIDPVARPLVHQIPTLEMNQALPFHPPVHANHTQPVEEYFPAPLRPPFNFRYHPPAVINQRQDDFVQQPIPLPPIVQHKLNDQLRPHAAFGEGHHHLEAVNHTANEEDQDDGPDVAYHAGDLGFFVDEEAGADGEERRINHAGLFEELFGNEDDDDEDENDDGPVVI